MKASIAYLVTGTSRGFGLALAEEIRSRGQWLYTLSRLPDGQDKKQFNIQCDLRDSRNISRAVARILEKTGSQSHDAIVLINNAGVLEPIGPVEQFSVQAVDDHFRVNLLAPVQLTAEFITATQEFPGQRRIINISSGAAHTPYAGWSLYCAAKAALNSFTACVALENKIRSKPVAVCTVAPGILDTDMQVHIREASPEAFPMRGKFVALYEEGRLSSPQKAARHLLDLDDDGRLYDGGNFDLRTLGGEQA